jgi:3-oxoacyl-[acyl-carrier-protein] synthase III
MRSPAGARGKPASGRAPPKLAIDRGRAEAPDLPPVQFPGIRFPMETFLIDVPMPSMGATVNELTVISLRTRVGDRIARGQKVAELESDKSVFEFESPCDGVVRAVHAAAGEAQPSGAPFLRIETADESLRHLAAKADGAPPPPPAERSRPIWTPRAQKLAQEAGMDPAAIADIEATGPGGRVSGDDFNRYLSLRARS